MTSKLIRISIGLLLLAGLFVFGLAGGKHWFGEAQAQAPPRPAATGELSRTITVVGEGTVQLRPDVVRATVGVEITGADIKTTTDEASRTMQDVMDALTEAGIAEKDMQTSNYNISIDRSMSSGPQAVEETQYRVRNTVQVTIRDLDNVGDVLDAAIEAGANSVSGVDFDVADSDQAMAEARRKAVADARARAEELAALHGVAVGGIVSISEVIGAGYALPIPIVGAAMGPVTPGQVEITTQLQVVYAIVPGATSVRPSILSPEEHAQTVTPAPTPTPVHPPTSGDPGGFAPAVTPATPAPTSTPQRLPTSSDGGTVPQTGPFMPVRPPTPTPVREGAAESGTSASLAVVVEERVVEAPYPASAPAAGQPAKVTIVGGDAETLREFVRRWLAPSYAGGPTDITLLLGELPEDLPFELSLPEDASVVGSLVRKNDTDYTQILLDVNQPAEEAVAIFIQSLEAQGFSAPRQDTSPSSVFVSSDPYQSNTLCHIEADVAVSISAIEVPDGATDVRLNVQRQKDYSPCQEPYPQPVQPYTDLLPQLTAPTDTQVRTSGGGRGTGYVEARAELTSELSAEALAEHYNAQLADAGWQQVDTSQAGPIAWSAWTTTDEDGDAWVATFYVVRRAGEPDQYLATLRAEQR